MVLYDRRLEMTALRALSLAALLALSCAPPSGRTERGAPPHPALRAQTPAPSAAEPARPEAPAVPTPAEAPSEPPGPVTLVAIGDVMLGRTVAWRIEHGPGSPLDGVKDALRAADVTVANLECAMGTGGTPVKKAYTFRAPPKAADVLKDAGIDVVSLANNHILDFGPEVFAQTLSLLDAAGIQHAGAGASEAAAHEPAILAVKGNRLAFLSYVRVPAEGKNGVGFDTKSWAARGEAPGLAWADDARITADVRAAKARADHVVVLLHSGNEESIFVSAAQGATAHAAIDAGASLVLGHHPHVLQAVERYKSGLIAYSLGNFVFDGKDVLGGILTIVLERNGPKEWSLTPIYTRNGAPQIVAGAWAKSVAHYVAQLPGPPK